MQQNYESWLGKYTVTRINKMRTSHTLVAGSIDELAPTYDISTDFGGARTDVDNALRMKKQHPLAKQISDLSDIEFQNTDKNKTDTQKQITQVFLYSLFLLSQDIPADQIGPHAKQLALEVSLLNSSLEYPLEKLNTISNELTALGTPKQAATMTEDQRAYADLEEAKTNEKWAIGGAVGSGGLSAAAIVTGGIVFGLGLATGPAAPIVWGVLGAIAAVGLAGVAVASYIASKFDDKIDRIEAQIEALESPENKGYGPVDIKSVTPPTTSPETQANLDAVRRMQTESQKGKVQSDEPAPQEPVSKSHP